MIFSNDVSHIETARGSDAERNSAVPERQGDQVSTNRTPRGESSARRMATHESDLAPAYDVVSPSSTAEIVGARQYAAKSQSSGTTPIPRKQIQDAIRDASFQLQLEKAHFQELNIRQQNETLGHNLNSSRHNLRASQTKILNISHNLSFAEPVVQSKMFEMHNPGFSGFLSNDTSRLHHQLDQGTLDNGQNHSARPLSYGNELGLSIR